MRLKKHLKAASVAAGLLSALSLGGATAADNAVPDFSSAQTGWVVFGPEWIDPPPGSGHGPVRNNPLYPLRGNRDGGQPTPRIGNSKDPVLKPWAAQAMEDTNQEVLTGKRSLPFMAQSRCYPGGVPGQLLYTAEPFFFVQTAKEVWMIWQYDHMVRRIRLDGEHPKNPAPSWFGDSVGHFENGDTLVIDTVGLSPRNNYIDYYRTPHSDKEHVIERFHLIDGGKTLQADVTVEDTDAFNEPLHMAQRWRKVNGPLAETVCAENNEDRFHQNLFPMPEAAKPDF